MEDFDGDGVGDNSDDGDDGGRADSFDVFPNDPTSGLQTVTVGNNVDPDDDNDGRCDDTTSHHRPMAHW